MGIDQDKPTELISARTSIENRYIRAIVLRWIDDDSPKYHVWCGFGGQCRPPISAQAVITECKMLACVARVGGDVDDPVCIWSILGVRLKRPLKPKVSVIIVSASPVPFNILCIGVQLLTPYNFRRGRGLIEFEIVFPADILDAVNDVG